MGAACGRPGPIRSRATAVARVLAYLSALALASAAAATPQSGPINSNDALRVSEAAIGRQLPAATLVDQHGRVLELASLRGRPLVLNFVYTSCAFVCPTLTAHLKDVVRVGRDALGANSFNVLTVGFDTRVDTPQRMAQFARERGIDLPGWYFASGDSTTIGALAAAAGFQFAPQTGGFDHVAQVTIVDPEGRVYRQVYGPDFEPPLLVDPLKNLLLGATRSEPPTTRWLTTVRLLCSAYDPRSGRYRFDYSLIVEIAIGLLCTIGVGLFIIRAWNQGRP